MLKTKVSKLIRVKQGHSVIEFELADDRLNIFYKPRAAPLFKVTLNLEAVNVLRDMLGDPQFTTGKPATRLPPDSLTDAQRREAEHRSPDTESGEGSDFKEGMD